MWSRSFCLALGLVGVVTFQTEHNVWACGGTFCGGGGGLTTTTMPVNQTGENIFFVMEGGYVEAHVNIQYNGNPAKFAWLIPLPSAPEISVGSQLFFSELLRSTVPTYSMGQGSDCRPPRDDSSWGCGGDDDDAVATGAAEPTNGTSQEADPEPEVEKVIVGAYEAAILSDGTAAGITNWLKTNDYEVPANLALYLQSYVEKNNVFVAVKLTPDSLATEIHPLVFRFKGDEPCVPIQLTAIAAEEDMGLRAFLLGDQVAAPTNYKHVVLNDAAVDWANPAESYDSVVSRAMDSPVVNGQGFVTEYASFSNVVQPDGFYSASWDSSAFLSITTSTAAIEELKSMGLIRCDSRDKPVCAPAHPLLPGMITKHMPLTSQFTSYEQVFQSPASYGYQLQQQAWNASAFAAEFEEKIAGPAAHASELLSRYSFLTRLFTRISPAEMTVDPTFHFTGDMPEVSNVSSATSVTHCDGSTTVSYQGQISFVTQGTPPSSSQFTPVLRVEEVPFHGEPFVLVDNREKIQQEAQQISDQSASSADSGCSLVRRKRSFVVFSGMALLACALFARRVTKTQDSH